MYGCTLYALGTHAFFWYSGPALSDADCIHGCLRTRRLHAPSECRFRNAFCITYFGDVSFGHPLHGGFAIRCGYFGYRNLYSSSRSRAG